MKKWWTMAFAAVLAASITACGSNNEEAAPADTAASTDAAAEAPATSDTSTDTATTTEAEPAADASSMSAEDLLNKAQEASKELKSYNLTATIDQTATINGEDSASKTTMNTDMILDPVAAYQQISVESAAGSTDIEQYITPDAIYTGMGGQWSKLPDEQRSQVMASLESTSNLDTSFDQFKTFAKDMTVTEEGDNYVLTAELSGDEVKSMAQDVLGQSGADEQTAAIMEQMNIEKMNLTYSLNKDTFYPTDSTIAMTMTMDTGAAAEGTEAVNMSMDMTMNNSISKHNEIDAIEVPQDVVDGAQ